MKAFVTGGSGFIGRELVKGLLREGYDNIKVYGLGCLAENYEDGRMPLEVTTGALDFSHGDMLDGDYLTHAMAGYDLVFHFAANPNVYPVPDDPHFAQGTVATHNVLRAMQEVGASRIVFASSSVVYGDTNSLEPIPETAPLEPISMYGASKVAAEAMIRAFCHTHDKQALIVRLANIIGPKPTHGILFNWRNALARNPAMLSALGDGHQEKSYLHVQDCVEAIMWLMRNKTDFFIKRGFVDVTNIGNVDTVRLSEIARMMVEKYGSPGAQIIYEGGDRGWRGDVPRVFMDTSKIRAMGWRPMFNSKQAVEKSLEGMP